MASASCQQEIMREARGPEATSADKRDREILFGREMMMRACQQWAQVRLISRTNTQEHPKPKASPLRKHARLCFTAEFENIAV